MKLAWRRAGGSVSSGRGGWRSGLSEPEYRSQAGWPRESNTRRRTDYPARVIGIHPESDLALLKIDAQGLPALTLRGTTGVTQGELVFAIGAPINPGNSGGPLVNAEGEVVGINTFILSGSGGSEGLGFAVPANVARFVYEGLRKRGYVRRFELGISAQGITPELASGLGLPRDSGVLVADVDPDGPAHEAEIGRAHV